MKVEADTIVTVTDGDFKILMGRGLTTFYEKEKSIFVLHTATQLETLLKMIHTAKAVLVEAD